MSERINFAVIGAGNIGKIHLQAIQATAGAAATVLCNRTATSGQPVASEFGVDWTDSYVDAVTRDDVDVVAICTPTGTHADIAIAAAEAGKHLFLEKPLDINVARADAIIAAAKANDVQLACIFPRRFSASTRAAKQAIDAGRLGRMTLVDVSVKWHRPQSYYDGSGNWRGTWALDGGGALMNQSIHYVDLARWLAGPVLSVTGRIATLAHEMEAEDTATAMLEFENGALGVIQGATSCWPGEPARVEIHGDRGAIVLEESAIVRWDLADAPDGEAERMMALESSSGSGASDPTAIGFEMHRRQVADLVEALQTGREPYIAGAEGRHAIEIVEAIYLSHREARAVQLPIG